MNNVERSKQINLDSRKCEKWRRLQGRSSEWQCKLGLSQAAQLRD
jgi:hypothetical protein